MRKIAIVLSRPQRRRLFRTTRKTQDAAMRTRYMIVLHTAAGKSQNTIAADLGCSVSTVKRTRLRWATAGEAGLVDRREDNVPPHTKANAAYAARLVEILQQTPRQFGHRRPTWTQELLVKVMTAQGFEPISRTSMSRLLARLGVRWGMPKPTVGCPWGKRRKNRRIRLIHRLIETLPPDEAAFWEDEVDIHLNPQIGPDWMLPGTQRQVPTPGSNVKRYLAGAMDASTDRMVWVSAEKKNSMLFIMLLKKLLTELPYKRLIHVILDNYGIHCSRQTQLWLAEHGQRIRLHFLPPYCPDDNRIERKVWREVHANVTRNHQCRSIDELMREVVYYLMKHNRTAKAAWLRCA